MKTKTLRRARRSLAGFSLAELMVVIVIIGLLATAVMTNAVQNFFIAARRKAEIDIVSICQAVDNYTILNGGRAPESLEVLVTPDENGRTMLKDRTTVPTDPWNNPYGYEPPTNNHDYRVFSYGKDGQPGGEGDNADIDNLTIVAAKSK
jgi:general secretion pathway protein G